MALPARIQPAKDAIMDFASEATNQHIVDLTAAIQGNAEAFSRLPPAMQPFVAQIREYVNPDIITLRA